MEYVCLGIAMLIGIATIATLLLGVFDNVDKPKSGYRVSENHYVQGDQLEELKKRVDEINKERARERNIMYGIAGHWLGWW